VLTMDLHAQQVQGFFDIPVDHLYSLPVLIKYLRQKLTGKTVVFPQISAASKWPRLTPTASARNLAIVAKERRSATETEALYLIARSKIAMCCWSMTLPKRRERWLLRPSF